MPQCDHTHYQPFSLLHTITEDMGQSGDEVLEKEKVCPANAEHISCDHTQPCFLQPHPFHAMYLACRASCSFASTGHTNPHVCINHYTHSHPCSTHHTHFPLFHTITEEHSDMGQSGDEVLEKEKGVSSQCPTRFLSPSSCSTSTYTAVQVHRTNAFPGKSNGHTSIFPVT